MTTGFVTVIVAAKVKSLRSCFSTGHKKPQTANIWVSKQQLMSLDIISLLFYYIPWLAWQMQRQINCSFQVYKLPLKATNTNCHFSNNRYNHTVLKIITLHDLPDFDSETDSSSVQCTFTWLKSYPLSAVKIVCFMFSSWLPWLTKSSKR